MTQRQCGRHGACDKPPVVTRPCPQWSMDHCRCPTLASCERWASHDAAVSEEDDRG